MSTKIAWTDETWNPITGCTKISEGCQNCYAEKMACRLAHMNIRAYQDVTAGDLENWFRRWNNETVFVEKQLEKPLKWKKPRRIFVCSMSDLFHGSVTFSSLRKIWDAMFDCPQHTFILLTKRPDTAGDFGGYMTKMFRRTWYDNLWLGVTVESQKYVKRITTLLTIPAAVRWVSVEPMIAPVSLRWLAAWPENKPYISMPPNHNGAIDHLDGLRRLDWVVIGCESGPKRRECKIEWMVELVEQCRAAAVPVFVKQVSISGRVEHDIDKFPEVLRVREYPKVT